MNEDTDPISAIVETFMNDKSFVRQAKDDINAIMADGKISKSDIPRIVGLLIKLYNSRKHLYVDNEKLGDVLYLVIIELLCQLDYYNSLSDIYRNKVNHTLRDSIDLVMTTAMTMISIGKCSCLPCS